MKIAILVGGLPPIYNGGTEIATTKIAQYAAKAGHEVHVIAADGSMCRQNRYTHFENGYKIHRVMTIPPHYWHGLFYMPSGVRHVLKIKPDIIHAQAIYMAASAYVASKLDNTPYLVYERGGIYLDWFMKKQMAEFLLGHASRVIAQTEHQKVELLEYCDKDVEVIPNGIDSNRFGKLRKQDARVKLNLPIDRPIVVFLGRFRPEKNPRCFINAAMANPDSNVLYLMIGDGQLLEEEKRYAKDYPNIMFTGLVHNENIPDYLSAADLMVNTSYSEGFPVSVLEGMASGLPIIAPNVTGIPEIIKHGHNGLLVESNNYLETAFAIRYMLSRSDFAMTVALNNRHKASLYTWENVVGKLYAK